MTNKTKTKRNSGASSSAKVKQLTEQIKNLKAKARPFATTGGIVGRSLGSMFGNAAMGSNIGKLLGHGIGSIFGSGDYTLTGQAPTYNVLANGKQIPKFSSTSATNIVCHREYLGDIQGTTAFNLNSYPLNPGMAQTFPWLASIAENYQEYKFHGLIFEFRPLITDFVTGGAPGVVVMATNYNADSVSYSSKQQMENSEFAVSVKPTHALMHGVECSMQETIMPQRYVRSGTPAAGQDLRLYDYGTFQFATQSNPVQNLGELWVSYCVEFYKPIMPTDFGGNIASASISRSSASGANPLGLIGVSITGTLPVTVNSTSVSFTLQPANLYLITISWAGTAAVVAFPTTTFTGVATVRNYWNNDTAPAGYGYVSGSSSALISISYLVTNVTGTAGTGGITYGVAGTIPTSANVDVVITQVDSSIA